MAESLSVAKRKTLQYSVASLCVESGFLSADRGAIEVLTQILQGYIAEIGNSSRGYCEMAQRLDPTPSDVQMALVDIGSKYNSLSSYAMRFPRRHLPRPLLETRNYPSPHAKCLQVGIKSQRPLYIPPYLPSLPDQHTYIKTPIYPLPETDYQCVKEKLTEQQYYSTKSLSKLLAKTKPSRPIAGEIDTSGLYSVLLSSGDNSTPVYINSLSVDTIEEQIEAGDIDKADIDNNNNIYINPYLKTPIKLN